MQPSLRTAGCISVDGCGDLIANYSWRSIPRDALLSIFSWARQRIGDGKVEVGRWGRAGSGGRLFYV